MPEFELKQRTSHYNVTFIEITINKNSTIRIDKEQLELLQKLHEYIFQKIFNLNFDSNFETSAYGGLIVIVKKRYSTNTYEINWNYMKEIVQNINLTIYDYINKNNENIDNVSNQIIHLAHNLKRIYKIHLIRNDLTPLSPSPSQKYQNYKELHEKTNNLETVYDNQPLVELKTVDTNLNLIQTNVKKFKGSSKLRSLYISEHVILLGFNEMEYFQLRLIPSTLYRLNCILKVAKLKKLIESDNYFISLFKNINQPKFEETSWSKSIKYHKVKEDEKDKKESIKFEDIEENCEINEIEDKINEMIIEICRKSYKECSCDDTTNSFENISIEDEGLEENNEEPVNEEAINNLTAVNIDEHVPKFLIIENQVTKFEIPSNGEPKEFPNVYELLQCLTLKSSNDSFDLERYEILGDCFLKLNTSLYIYCQFKSTSEGKLTFLKSQRVSNRYLFKLASEKLLNDYVIGDGFRINDNWLPPNSKLKNDENSSKIEKYFTNQTLSDKSLADCVEALLGVYLIKCGTGAARAFLTWLDFIISKNETTDFTKLLELPNPLLTENNLDLKSLHNKFASFEKSIGYRFQNIIYLLQAFTHPSDMSNRHTGSYQRLEFIGDAVLDLLVTQFLFNDEKEHSPGELTDLRQALVNNNFFAYLSTKHNFHKFISYESKNMFGELDNYLKIQKNYTPKNAYFSSHEVSNENFNLGR